MITTEETLYKDVSLTIEEIIELLDEIIYSKTIKKTLPQSAYEKERLVEILLDLMVIRRFIVAVAQGDLSVKLNMKGYLAGALKMLQASLKHLTWQTQMIASGDMTQRVDFMGEFSTAFNDMVRKLDETMKSLKQKESELMQTNEVLTKEIEQRKVIEQSLRESQELYRTLSQTDPLTGIFNRRHFYILAERELKRSYRYKRPMSVLMLDVDFFKKVNDTYGHGAGDKVLQLTARMAAQSLRSVDVLARYGGEEFVALLPETNISGAVKAAEKIRCFIESSTFDIDRDIGISITASIGVCSAVPEGVDSVFIDSLIAGADAALYDAKEAGRNRVCICKTGVAD